MKHRYFLSLAFNLTVLLDKEFTRFLFYRRARHTHTRHKDIPLSHSALHFPLTCVFVRSCFRPQTNAKSLCGAVEKVTAALGLASSSSSLSSEVRGLATDRARPPAPPQVWWCPVPLRTGNRQILPQYYYGAVKRH